MVFLITTEIFQDHSLSLHHFCPTHIQLPRAEGKTVSLSFPGTSRIRYKNTPKLIKEQSHMHYLARAESKSTLLLTYPVQHVVQTSGRFCD